MSTYLTRLLFSILLLTGVVRAQMVIVSPPANSVSSSDRIAVTVIGKPGEDATLYINEEETAKGTIRIDGIYDFLNVEVPRGPVHIKVEAPGARNRIFTAERDIHIIGPPKKALPYEDDLVIPADGYTQREIQVKLEDDWGYTVTSVKHITAKLTRGKIITEDADRINPGQQVPVKNGLVSIMVQAPETSGEAILELSINREYFQFPIRFSVPAEPFILVGTADGNLSMTSSPQEDTDLPAIDATDNYYHGRLAFYAKGAIAEKYKVTASYDSERDKDNQLFDDIDPNDQYPIFGDASELRYDAQTRSKLFAKIERDASFALVGDFNTNLAGSEFTAYNRSFNGIYTNWQGKHHSLQSFATLTNRKLQLDEIRGEGISGFYFLSQGDITKYSDKIHLETRDRYHPEIVLRSQDLVRFQDYDINYVQGTLMFKQPVNSMDANNNPIFIVTSYEYQTTRSETPIGGVRYSGTFGKRVKMGSTMIYEERSPSAYMLYGVDGEIPITRGLSINGEFAESSVPGIGGQAATGQAYRTELKFNFLNFLKLDGYYRKVDSSFVNPSQSGAGFDEGGSEKYGTHASLHSKTYGSLTSEFYRQFNRVGTVNENRVNVLNVAYEKAFLQERLKTNLGFEDAVQEKFLADSMTFSDENSRILSGALTYQMTTKLSGSVSHEQNLGNADLVKPTNTALAFQYDLSEKLTMYLKHRLLHQAGGKNQTILGFDSKVAENTELMGKYEIGGATGETRNRASIGIRNKWQVHPDFTLNVGYESTATIDSLEVPTPDHDAFAFSFEYLPEAPWKSMGKIEFRRDPTTHKLVLGMATDFKLFHGLSTIIKLDHMNVDYLNAGDDYARHAVYQLGMAYRPDLMDKFNSVGKIAFLTDQNTHVDQPTREDRLIFSVHGYYQPTRWLELGSRIATRRVFDEEGVLSDEVITNFISGRAELDWSLKWSSAVDVRYMHITPAGGWQSGAAAEMNYLVMKNTQLGLGYIFKNFEDDDPDFSYLNYQLHNFYISFHLKFSESIFDWR
ncbi:MAG: hypothetical protein K9N34_07225 [Candidatus Marinimicrobia bacterium]|nr:hypothetical protein [Candidatus Neomarinimicrobiota bacterium]MCF7840392.1 hypothetical protein [Candidatus Neomarinimicrobiota bacterium]